MPWCTEICQAHASAWSLTCLLAPPAPRPAAGLPYASAEGERRHHLLKHELPDEARGMNALRWGCGCMKHCLLWLGVERPRAFMMPGGQSSSLCLMFVHSPLPLGLVHAAHM